MFFGEPNLPRERRKNSRNNTLNVIPLIQKKKKR